MKQQAIDYINKKIEKYSKMVEKSEKIYKWNESKYTFHWWASYWYEKWKLWAYEDMKDELQALWDGWWIFIVPWKTYYIWDNWIPAVALHPRFQYSNWTIDTIHHTNISELPPNK